MLILCYYAFAIVVAVKNEKMNATAVQHARDTMIVILFDFNTTVGKRVSQYFVLSSFKIFASTVVFKFQTKAESKDIQRLFSAVVHVQNCGYLISCFYSKSLVLSNFVVTDCKLL